MEREIELLAPARDKQVALAAIACGADAIYIGGPNHGARASASVSLEDIREVVKAAHPFGVRVYVALNTLVYDNEIDSVKAMILQLVKAGIDALIVQDMSLTEMKLPQIALHASTQCDIRTVEKFKMLHEMGFTRAVPARELTLDEMAAMHHADPDMEIEAFVHGALCVCYSGDCRASFASTGRSANRGECSQMCRHAYTLVDGHGNELIKDKYLLSLKDLNRSEYLEQMLTAGVTSFKIEGRLKDAAYVMETVGYYRRQLDRIIAAHPGVYRRSSYGTSQLSFIPDVKHAFNRGFTAYFTDRHTRGGNLHMTTLDSTGRIGTAIGRVKRHRRNGSIEVTLQPGITLTNGDGLSWFDNTTNRASGMRVNRADGNIIFPAPGTTELPAPGTELRRTSDTARTKLLSAHTSARRTIEVKAILRIAAGHQLTLDLEDERGIKVSSSVVTENMPPAIKPQEEQRRKVITKTGDTIYTITQIDDRCGDTFIQASILTQLRRDALLALDSAQEATFKILQPAAPKVLPIDDRIEIGNVANHLARQAYLKRGVKQMEQAAETSSKGMKGQRVMTTRYCLRRELGRCLQTEAGRQWTEPLHLIDASGTRFDCRFDCRKCEMNLYLT